MSDILEFKYVKRRSGDKKSILVKLDKDSHIIQELLTLDKRNIKEALLNDFQESYELDNIMYNDEKISYKELQKMLKAIEEGCQIIRRKS